MTGTFDGKNGDGRGRSVGELKFGDQVGQQMNGADLIGLRRPNQSRRA